MQAGTLVFDGDAGFDSLTSLAEQVNTLTNPPQDVEVRWSDAQWVHFACLQYLVALRRTLEQAGKRLLISQPSAPVAQILRDFGLSDLIGAA